MCGESSTRRRTGQNNNNNRLRLLDRPPEPVIGPATSGRTRWRTMTRSGFMPANSRWALFGIESRGDQTWRPIQCDLLHVGPFLGRFILPRLGKHVADPSGSLGRSGLQGFILKRLPFGILLAADVCPFALWEGSIQENIPLEIVGIQVSVAVQPIAVLLSEFN